MSLLWDGPNYAYSHRLSMILASVEMSNYWVITPIVVTCIILLALMDSCYGAVATNRIIYFIRNSPWKVTIMYLHKCLVTGTFTLIRIPRSEASTLEHYIHKPQPFTNILHYRMREQPQTSVKGTDRKSLDCGIALERRASGALDHVSII